MQLTVQIKMQPSAEQIQLLKDTATEYIELVNRVVATAVEAGAMGKPSSRTVEAMLPSALKNQAIQDAKSVYRRMHKTGKASVLRRPVAIWNNQNWRLVDGVLSFPVWREGRSQRMSVPVHMADHPFERLKGKTGTLRITGKKREVDGANCR